ncbi:MAG TPA: YgaP-like transmembrane domain [Candidatus Acidoferrales bacterium]|nr:YgaP-like transmembrane domain [Candidatus Acidoferrales bacterium]
MLPATTYRVTRQSPDAINERIRRRTAENIARYSSAGPDAIRRRLDELDHEWDIERALQANAASVSLLGLALGALVDRRWFMLPAFVAGFLLQHALQGWCPPVAVFRRLGVRTASEVDCERYALKALRGGFKDIARSQDGNWEVIEKTLRAVRL